MCTLLTMSYGDACSCVAAICSAGALVVAILAWRVAKKQLSDSVNALKTANSLEILSWFDEKDIKATLQQMYQENQNVVIDAIDEGILDLLFILDTACTLIKTSNINIELLSQMHDDFVEINKNKRVECVLNSHRIRFKHLDIPYLIKQTDLTASYTKHK